ncbi:hypothetical protein PTI98_005603 [Pleurotus ostreatus]|nr:hypothetical protein PTI98_005603 [Pleurotus ostreatus]
MEVILPRRFQTMSKVIAVKGLADILTALILVVKPAFIYNSVPTRAVASFTGLHLSNAEVAPGFNQAIACMVAAVGVGHIVASRCSPNARVPIFAMNLTWATLNLLTCVMPQAWGIGSATQLMSALNHTAFSLAMYFTDPVFRAKSKAE